jgi:hypothetical protein
MANAMKGIYWEPKQMVVEHDINGRSNGSPMDYSPFFILYVGIGPRRKKNLCVGGMAVAVCSRVCLCAANQVFIRGG